MVSKVRRLCVFSGVVATTLMLTVNVFLNNQSFSLIELMILVFSVHRSKMFMDHDVDNNTRSLIR